MSQPLGRKPLLLAVPHDWSCVNSVLNKATSLFSRIVHGNSVDEFISETASLDPIVLLIGGAGSHDVLKEVLRWRDNTGNQRVQWVHSYWTGVDAFRVPELADAFGGVPLTNARSVFGPMLAEHVILSALYFNRQVPLLQSNRKNKIYNRFPSIPFADQTLGIIGYGDIGRFVAKAALHGLAMKQVKGLKTQVTAQGTIDDLGVSLFSGSEGMQEILTTSDVVVAILPNTPHTKGLIGREQFNQMKKNAVFINIGRGATVNEDDLVDAIKAKVILGAALDVFEQEPLPASSKLWELDDNQLLLSPHNADINAHSYTDAVEDFVQYATRYCETGELPAYRIDPRKGY